MQYSIVLSNANVIQFLLAIKYLWKTFLVVLFTRGLNRDLILKHGKPDRKKNKKNASVSFCCVLIARSKIQVDHKHNHGLTLIRSSKCESIKNPTGTVA